MEYLFLHRIRPRPFRWVESSFYSANWIDWGNISLADFWLPSLSCTFPPLLLTQVLFLKSHADIWLLYFWMPFPHPPGALRTFLLHSFPSWHPPPWPHSGCLLVDEIFLIYQWHLLVRLRMQFRQKMQFYLHCWKHPPAVLPWAVQ